jgi:precorrin-4/cobalt-precorrin-4 C11-methyltransferase
MKERASNHKQRLITFGGASTFFLLQLVLASSLAYGKSAGVYLVGLGPGDPDLATVKAVRLLQEADVIYTFGGDICDRFASYLKDKQVRVLPSGIFTRYHVRRSMNKPHGPEGEQSSGVEKERRSLSEEVRQAVALGKVVLFIDSGDPLIYGPWVWMLQEFQDMNVEVVPGISSFNAGLAALKRDGTWAPNTHSIILTTDRPQSQDRLEALAALRCSMVIFTHRTKFEDIIRKLKTRYAPETPIAVVFYAGYKEKQRVISGNLETIESAVKPEALPLEHIIFVGDFLTYDFKTD